MLTGIENSERKHIFCKNNSINQSETKSDLSATFAMNFKWFTFNSHPSWWSPQPVITCSKLTIETLDPGVKYVQS